MSTCPECSKPPGLPGPKLIGAPWSVDGVWLGAVPHRRSSSTHVPDNVSESHTPHAHSQVIAMHGGLMYWSCWSAGGWWAWRDWLVDGDVPGGCGDDVTMDGDGPYRFSQVQWMGERGAVGQPPHPHRAVGPAADDHRGAIPQ